ncbi:3'-5' DNA helicase [Tilletia horrida]|uniref:ATP-dependent DNA helicase n=1 Tax=Tilletia horrida TaxID=155126 RepID=A0AAN6GS73_9BASI|nr:3'-5' DNA helicase [Tilletia horrida]
MAPGASSHRETNAGEDLDLLDGDDAFWELAETQMLSTSNPAQLVRAGSASTSSTAARIATPSRSASLPQASNLGSKSGNVATAPTSSHANQRTLHMNPKIPTVRPMTALASSSDSPSKSTVGGGGTIAAAGTQSFVQRNLFGEVANVPGPSRSRSAAGASGSMAPPSRGKSSTALSQLAVSDGNLTAQMTFKSQKVTQQWDFSQPIRKGRSVAKGGKSSKAKGKQRAKYEDEGDYVSNTEESDASEYGENEPASSSAGRPSTMPGATAAMKLQIDTEAAKTWIYPTNKSFRDYQFNIVQKALFNNVLVALPTGLGKTFIAAVVILNFYRWFPKGKIIFVAPTKPLVSQQQIACHGICGLPWDQAIELTVSPCLQWKSKRIFYMTPQTFENDLMSESCDPRDVVCLVVDEAHRATGNYAYSCVVRHLMRHNRHFRVLALTATPGSTSEKVQEVIDSLHIGHIEIRSEEALDIRSYIHRKIETKVIVPAGPVVGALQDALGMIIRHYLDKVIGAGALRSGTDPKTLHPFMCRKMANDKSRSAEYKRLPWLRASLLEMAVLADCMQNLTIYSVEMFRTRFYEAVEKAKRGKAYEKQKLYSNSNEHFRKVMKLLEDGKDRNTNQVIHPKMATLLEMVQEHFDDHDVESEKAEIAHWTEGDGLHGKPAPKKRETKAMVFCHYRECVSEIVEFLKAKGLKAVSFVGQASSKGGKGCTQKQQQQIIQDFKAGKTNIIVATSVGEEGLDIGEVDLIVCYDAQKDPLQRVGRTGRQRDGKIYVLLSAGKEEKNWQQSKDSYKTVQKEINAGYSCELFDDVERLVPKDLQPACVKEEVKQFDFDPNYLNQSASYTTSFVKGKKKTERKDPRRNIPQGSILGFLKASEVSKPSHSRRKNPSKSEDEDEDSFLDADDDDDGLDWSILNQIPTQKLQASNEKAGLRIPARAQDTSGRSLFGAHSLVIPKRSSPSPSPEPLPSFSDLESSLPSLITQDPKCFASSSSSVSSARNTRFGDTSSSSPLSRVTASARQRKAHPLVVQMAAESGIVLKTTQKARASVPEDADFDDFDDEDDGPVIRHRRTAGRTTTRRHVTSSSSSPACHDENMMPPPLPVSAQRRAAYKPKRKASDSKENEGRSDDAGRGAPSSKRIKLSKKMIGNSQTSKALFAYEAERDTDEEQHGERDEDDEGLNTDEADSSDLEHVGSFDPTQHAGYDQRSIYAQSLMTQTSLTPFRKNTRGFGVGGFFGEGGIGRAGLDSRGQPLRASRPASTPMDGSDDRYTEDSFVVADDEAIVYESGDGDVL